MEHIKIMVAAGIILTLLILLLLIVRTKRMQREVRKEIEAAQLRLVQRAQANTHAAVDRAKTRASTSSSAPTAKRAADYTRASSSTRNDSDASIPWTPPIVDEPTRSHSQDSSSHHHISPSSDSCDSSSSSSDSGSSCSSD